MLKGANIVISVSSCYRLAGWLWHTLYWWGLYLQYKQHDFV